MVQAFWKHALTIAFMVGVAGAASVHSVPAAAQDGSGRPPAAARRATSLAVLDLGSITATLRLDNASFGGGAVGLRNRSEGGIEVSGATTPIKRALIYWAVITTGVPPVAANRIEVKRGGANAAFTTIVGTAVGSGGSPCWAGDRTTVYRGAIPLAIANNNGLYIVRLKPGANGSTNGGTPWANPRPPLPLFEGASIVLVGSGSATVAIYDTGLAGRMFFDKLTYKLNSPVSVASASEVLFRNIGADGQKGVDLEELAGTSGEITTLNNRRIAGPASPAIDGDWNGAVAGPLPQLWDDTTHTVTTQAKAGASPTVLPFAVFAPDDCLVPIANLLSIESTP